VCNSNTDEGCTDQDMSQFNDEFRPPGCTAADARDCIIRNKWTAQSGAHIENMPWYQPTAEFYPWLPGSRIYNTSHWRECEFICRLPLACLLPLSAHTAPYAQMIRVHTRSRSRDRLSRLFQRTMA
jgi:hypothetical protein